MKDHTTYMFGKLAHAVEILVTNTNDLRERLWVASPYLFMVQPDCIAESCRDDIIWIHQMMTRYPAQPPYRSSLQATYHRTRQSTAHKIAKRIWTLYHMMRRVVESRHEPRPARRSKLPQVRISYALIATPKPRARSPKK